MPDEIHKFLLEDMELICEGLDACAEYDFTRDLRQRMEAMPISSLALGVRCYVSHTIVDKWRQGKARPNSKERMKELGMALGMDAPALNTFLYLNGYPKLYAKNPLDSAARFTLEKDFGAADIVTKYRAMIERLGIGDFVPPANVEPLMTQVLSADLRQAAREGQVTSWFRRHEKHFSGGPKTQLPDLQIVRFFLLYLGESSIHELATTGELPPSLKAMLYALCGKRALFVHGLRDKLITFGLYSNMTEDEIDTLLNYARLRRISEPATKVDSAVLFALRNAHERYPYYEANNLTRIVSRLSSSSEVFDQVLLPVYRSRLAVASAHTRYYEKHHRTAEELLFEQTYTEYADRGVMDYVCDMLQLLAEKGVLSRDQVKPMCALLSRTQDGETIWD